MSMNQLAAGTNVPAHSVTPVLIPDADGQYGRGFRDCLESFKLAAASLSIPTSQVDQVVATLHDAYSNNADRTNLDEVSESLVVSTWHVNPDEREMLARKIKRQALAWSVGLVPAPRSVMEGRTSPTAVIAACR